MAGREKKESKDISTFAELEKKKYKDVESLILTRHVHNIKDKN